MRKNFARTGTRRRTRRTRRTRITRRRRCRDNSSGEEEERKKEERIRKSSRGGRRDLFVCKLVTKSADRSGRARIAMARTVVAIVVVE